LGTFTIGDHEWMVKRFDGYWSNGDHGLLFFNTNQSERIENVDIKAILDFAIEDYNDRLDLNKSEVFVRGVQTWMEPLAGYINTTPEGLKIRLNNENLDVRALTTGSINNYELRLKNIKPSKRNITTTELQ